MSDVVPDLAEEYVGWRAWVVVEGPRLASLPGTPIWEPGQALEAECGRHHEPPGENCSCGIYAAKSRDRLGEMRYGHYDLWKNLVVVVGEISLWGGVVPAEWGFRAQFAYPRKLLLPYECWELMTPLRDDYRVPVKLANTFRLKRSD
jgi:hypothetical protein